MRIFKTVSLVFFTGLLFTACSSDDDEVLPEAVNEEEIITTLTVTLSPDGDGDDIVLSKTDLDGDGPNPPVLDVSGNLTVGTSYTGSIVLLNETEDPAENITLEVEEENTDHQFFYIPDANLDVTTEYGNNDDDGNPLGTQFSLDAGAASAGTLTVTLRHQPKKPNDGTLADAAGETDVDATFSLTIE